MHVNCPYCDGEIDKEIEIEWWKSKDYSVWYETECPKCDGKLQVEVRQMPQFWYEKYRDPVVFKNP